MRRVACWLVGMVLSAYGGVGVVSAAPTIHLDVDATDLPRNLARATQRIAANPGPMDLFFVLWSPGNHTPSGPVENLVDLVISDCKGQRLDWNRDADRMEKFSLTVPQGCDTIQVSLTYIAGQPNANSRSTDSYGRPALAVLNWNTVLLYPAGASHREITVSASLALPSEWAYATALEPASTDGERFATFRALDPARPVNVITFETVPLAELVDSPVIMGRHIKSFPLVFERMESVPPHRVNVAAAEADLADVPAWLLTKIAETCRQSMLLCGNATRPFPRERYEFLLPADSALGFAVEHGESTLTSMGPRTFKDAKEPDEKSVKGGGASLVVLAHEYFHAWCGKLAAPDGLVRPDFSTPARTELLWVYEGLTTYYDNILAARGGLITAEEYKQELLELAVALEQRSGRLWRSVEDTAVAARMLRNRGLYWYDKRRGQEYYGEGGMFWAEADAIIRRATDGARSLDDFCRALFDVPVNPVGAQATYSRADVVRLLGAVEPSTDWDALIRARIEEPAPSLDLGPILALLGWRIDYADEPTPEQKKLIDEGDTLNLRTSLGVRVSKDAEITDIVPGSPADLAGLAYGMKILAVDGWEYSKDRAKDAVKDTPRTKGVEFILTFGGRVETMRVPYDGGPRVPRLVRIEGERDLIAEVVRAR